MHVALLEGVTGHVNAEGVAQVFKGAHRCLPVVKPRGIMQHVKVHLQEQQVGPSAILAKESCCGRKNSREQGQKQVQRVETRAAP